MIERGILQVLTKLDVDYRYTDGEWCMCACPLAPYRMEHPKGTDNNPGFGVHIEEDDVSYYHCFTCKSKGTLAGLAMLLGKYREEPELIELGKQIDREEIFGGSVQMEWMEDAPAKATSKTRNTNFPNEREFEDRYPAVYADPVALGYLRRRGISVSTAIGLGLRYDQRKRRILFPIYDYWSGRYAGCSGRSILGRDQLQRIEDRTGKPEPKVRDYHRLQKDSVLLGGRRGIVSSRSRLGVQPGGTALRTSGVQPAYLVGVEGLFALARVFQLGWRSNSFGLLGSELTPGKAAILEDINLPTFWFTDDDPAGHACLYGRWDKELERHKGNGALHALYHSIAQFVPRWPEGKDDPDQLTKYEVDKMIDEADLYAEG